MSLGYAEKLSYREDVGKVGMPEILEDNAQVTTKIEELAKLVKKSKHTVIFTGAGISTSCGIPDFRGPNGIWTIQASGRPLPKSATSFSQASPSFTHMAIKTLVDCGKAQFVISQNVDGLHLRSGLPLSKLAELHGNCFRESCGNCGAQYIRDFEIETIGLKQTGRSCTGPRCRGRLKDSVLDWEDSLPLAELTASEEHCRKADLVICLGTSLQITPACNLPLLNLKNGGKMVIVNLQRTPKDRRAHLVIHARVDKVIRATMAKLDLLVRPFVRVQRVILRHAVVDAPSWQGATSIVSRKMFKLSVESSHGPKAPLPFVHQVMINVVLEGGNREGVGGIFPKFLTSHPFQMTLAVSIPETALVQVSLLLDESCSANVVELGQWAVSDWLRKEAEGAAEEGVEAGEWCLAAEAMAQGNAGGVAVLEKEESGGIGSQLIGVVTHFVEHESSLDGKEDGSGDEKKDEEGQAKRRRKSKT